MTGQEVNWPQPLSMVRNPEDAGRNKPASLDRDVASSLNTSVLIVEDEGLVALNIEGALTEAGFEVIGIVDTEEEAVDSAQQLRPDVILLDITLREGDGISAARRIHQSTNIKIIFISGNSDPRTLAEAEATKPAGFMRKPFVTDSLAMFIKNAIAQKT
jgi:DNA-binding NarL/FixJ family response regulator